MIASFIPHALRNTYAPRGRLTVRRQKAACILSVVWELATPEEHSPHKQQAHQDSEQRRGRHRIQQEEGTREAEETWEKVNQLS